MRRASVIAIASLALFGSAASSGRAGSGDGPLRTLVDAERAFAHRATEVSTRQAFGESFGKDGIVFRPVATNHHLWAAQNPEWGTKGLLTWDPAFGRASQSGDFGYTTGPAEFRPVRDMKTDPVWWGWFVSVWSREGGGPWRVVLDTGTSVPKPDGALARFEPTAAMERIPRAARADRHAGLENLKRAEATFVERAGAKGIAAAYRESLAEKGRVHRDEHAPAIGREAGIAVLDAKRTSIAWKTDVVRTASTADLGFAYGTGEARNSDGTVTKFAFVRIWELDDREVWRIVLDVETPIPVTK